MESSFTAIDIETTGLSPIEGSRVIEIAAVRFVDSQITEEFSSLIDFGGSIPKKVEKLTGITSSMLFGQMDTRKAIEVFEDFIGNTVLVAHNSKFERAFLQSEFSRAGKMFSNKLLCTLRASREKLPSLQSYSLISVARHFFKELPSNMQVHRALPDARLTGSIWIELLNIE